jgi:hypothetical protein
MSTFPPPSPPLWKLMLLGACAGGLGWGIRGQYGHETGAMMAGLLVSLVLTFLLAPHGPSSAVARAVAWGTIAMGFGGSMTYGQTVGLTHDAALVGNHAALAWGMLGLAIKGGLWIGFAGAFLGLGLGGNRYRPGELLTLMLGLLALSALGIWVLNEPFEPTRKILPWIYFSDDWRWEPGADLKPRREVWGGFLFAWVGLVAYLHWVRRDPLAPRLAFWGLLGGAIGFPAGQSLQAFHAWNPDLFQSGFGARLEPVINWWNFMETTFGALMGAVLALGLGLNRTRIRFDEIPEAPWPVPGELGLLAVHVSLLVTVEFLSVGWVDEVYDFGLCLGILPVVGVAAGRWWPWLMMGPITLLPIAGKTLRNLVYEQATLPVPVGWILFVIIPLAVATCAALWLANRRASPARAGTWLGPVLLANTWLYFALNFAFFQFPWPWQTWTARTPNALIFTACALALTAGVSRRRARDVN